MIPATVINLNKIMKKLFLALILFFLFISCDKNAIQQTTDSLKNADSLFTKANDGLKTLDSISKTITDSEGIAKKIIIPEIEKQKKVIDSTLRNGGFKMDSINKEIEKITKNVGTGTAVVKALDSANQAIKNGESPIAVLTKTADKILKQTKREEVPKKSPSESNRILKPEENSVIIPPYSEKDPIVKSGILEIEVENISAAKDILREKLRNNSAELVTEKFSQTEGFEREYITVKVPLKNFDGLIADFSSDLGEVRVKNTNMEGTDYVSKQMCDVEITLVQKEKIASTTLTTDDSEKNPDSFGAKFSGAFMSGFKVLGDIMIAVLPFWPLFLIAGIIWYFVRKNRRKLAQEEFEKHQKTTQQANFQTENLAKNTTLSKELPKNETSDYSKYLPKE